MADKSTPLILDALSRAVAEPGGLALHSNRKTPGLFAATAAGKQSAHQCLEQGYLRISHSESKGKTTQEICAITEKGLAYLLEQVSPKHVLEELVRVLEARRNQAGELVSIVRQWQTDLEKLQGIVEHVLQRVQQSGSSIGVPHILPPSRNGSDAWVQEVAAYLVQWRESGTSSDCALPELYRRALAESPSLTIGHFHDGLRRLHDQGQIYLHPWTGPLYEIPEPAYALLIGHEVAYYASVR